MLPLKTSIFYVTYIDRFFCLRTCSCLGQFFFFLVLPRFVSPLLDASWRTCMDSTLIFDKAKGHRFIQTFHTNIRVHVNERPVTKESLKDVKITIENEETDVESFTDSFDETFRSSTCPIHQWRQHTNSCMLSGWKGFSARVSGLLRDERACCRGLRKVQTGASDSYSEWVDNYGVTCE